MANPSAPSGGQDTTAPGTKGSKAAQERMPAEKQQKSTQQAPPGGQAPAAQPVAGRQERSRRPSVAGRARAARLRTPRQSQDDKSAPATRQSQGRAAGAQQTQQQTQSPSTGGAKQGASGQPATGTQTGQQGAAGRPMTSSNVSLTTEQRTTIRQTVLTSSAPRVTNVNFDIKVGTVVPRTVRVAPLPVTLIEIQPSWRGYMYFVYNDEIIVVEPGTLRIVAVLEV